MQKKNKPQFILMGNIIAAQPRRSGTLTAVYDPCGDIGYGSSAGSIYAGAVMGAIIGASIDG